MEVIEQSTNEKYKIKLLELFQKFIIFCEDYSLNYFCTGGTMLGAVRHHGFIPWDDDIDLFMMRKDYNRLISLQDELNKRGLGLEGVQCNNKYAVFLKIWDKNTTLWEIEEIPFVYGVYIDIFPLDYSDDTVSEFREKYKKRRNLFLLYQLSQMKFSFHSLRNRLKQKDYKFIVKGLISLFVPCQSRNIIRKLILRDDAKKQKGNGQYLASYYGDYWEREYLKREWFEDFILVDFENLKVKIPIGYDGYLSQIYHDYKKLPPKEKQITHHYHFFLDLNRHLTLKEIKQLKR